MFCSSSSTSKLNKIVFTEEALECYAILARSSLAHLLSYEALAAVARISRIQQYRSQKNVYAEGELTQDLYLLSAGAIELCKTVGKEQSNTASGKIQSLPPQKISMVVPFDISSTSSTDSVQLSEISFATIRAGRWFGQCAALGVTTRQCSARALKDARCVSINWSRLEEIFRTLNIDISPIKVALGLTVMKQLRRAQFFHGLEKVHASLLSTLFCPRLIPKGTVVFEEGEVSDDGPSIFFCNSGQLTMHQDDPTRGPVLIRQIQPGEFFGEACMFFQLPRIATVRTISECQVSELPFPSFATFIRQYQEVKIDVTCAFNNQSIPIQHLLRNPIILVSFAKFIASEASLENLDFWLAARKFRLQITRNNHLICQDANKLFSMYVSPDAARQINLKGTALETLQKAIEHKCITKYTFEEAESEILRLMEMDSFSRFRSSADFEQCLIQCRDNSKVRRNT